MKKLKTKTKLVIAIIALAMTFVLTIGYGFAWYILSDEANKLTLQIKRYINFNFKNNSYSCKI